MHKRMSPMLLPEVFALYRIHLLEAVAYLHQVEVDETEAMKADRLECVAMGARLEQQIDQKGRALFADNLTLNSYSLMLQHLTRRARIMMALYQHMEESSHAEDVLPA